MTVAPSKIGGMLFREQDKLRLLFLGIERNGLSALSETYEKPQKTELTG